MMIFLKIYTQTANSQFFCKHTYENDWEKAESNRLIFFFFFWLLQDLNDDPNENNPMMMMMAIILEPLFFLFWSTLVVVAVITWYFFPWKTWGSSSSSVVVIFVLICFVEGDSIHSEPKQTNNFQNEKIFFFFTILLDCCYLFILWRVSLPWWVLITNRFCFISFQFGH